MKHSGRPSGGALVISRRSGESGAPPWTELRTTLPSSWWAVSQVLARKRRAQGALAVESGPTLSYFFIVDRRGRGTENNGRAAEAGWCVQAGGDKATFSGRGGLPPPFLLVTANDQMLVYDRG